MSRIICGMRFRDAKRREFLITEVFYRNISDASKSSLIIETPQGYRIHISGGVTTAELVDVGFRELDKDRDLIVRPLKEIQDLERNRQIIFF